MNKINKVVYLPPKWMLSSCLSKKKACYFIIYLNNIKTNYVKRKYV